MSHAQALVVDIDPMGRMIAAHFLENQGFETTAFRTAEAAESWVSSREERPRLAVVALRLRGNGGAEFARRLVDTNPETRVLFTAARNVAEVRKAALPRGSFEVLDRRHHADDFERAIVALMSRPTLEESK